MYPARNYMFGSKIFHVLFFLNFTGDQLSILIPFLIRQLRSTGYKVLVVNSDQAAVNRKAFSLLGLTIDNPFFYVDDDKVWGMHDIPHLMKSVRKMLIFRLYFFTVELLNIF